MSRWNLVSENGAERCYTVISLKQFPTGMSLTLCLPLLIERLIHLLIDIY